MGREVLASPSIAASSAPARMAGGGRSFSSPYTFNNKSRQPVSAPRVENHSRNPFPSQRETVRGISGGYSRPEVTKPSTIYINRGGRKESVVMPTPSTREFAQRVRSRTEMISGASGGRHNPELAARMLVKDSYARPEVRRAPVTPEKKPMPKVEELFARGGVGSLPNRWKSPEFAALQKAAPRIEVARNTSRIKLELKPKEIQTLRKAEIRKIVQLFSPNRVLESGEGEQTAVTVFSEVKKGDKGILIRGLFVESAGQIAQPQQPQSEQPAFQPTAPVQSFEQPQQSEEMDEFTKARLRFIAPDKAA